MKKLKYLLFIIPLFFIFVGNSKAFNIYSCGDITVNEQFILDRISSVYSDDDLSDYNYLLCYKQSSYDGTCNLLNFDINSYLAFSSQSTDIYNFRIDYNSYPRPYYYSLKLKRDIFNNCTISSFEVNKYNTFPLAFRYVFPLVDNGINSAFFYTNFDSTFINNTVGNDLYTYNVLSLLPPEPEPEEPTIENKIYLPNELEEGNCPILLNQNVIRVYEEEPQVNTPINYTDYYINSHYLTQTGTETLSNTVSCMDLEYFTTSYVYRFDFYQIILIFLAIIVIVGYPLMKIIHSFFIGFKRR